MIHLDRILKNTSGCYLRFKDLFGFDSIYNIFLSLLFLWNFIYLRNTYRTRSSTI